jgi:Sulfatase
MDERGALTPWQWIALALAVGFLDLVLTFYNVWPSLWIRPSFELSVELGVLLLGIVAYAARRGGVPRALHVALLVLLVLLVIGRYAEVTSPALYGRPVNFYWDARHLPAVAAMLAKVAPWWALIGLVLGVAALFGAVTFVLSLALSRVTTAVRVRSARRALGVVGIVLVGIYSTSHAFAWKARYWYALPVSATYLQQADFLLDAYAASTSRRLPAVQWPASNFRRLEGGDVLLMFLESYGAVTYDASEIAEVVSPARKGFADAVQATGRRVLSMFVESPTFGGGSWLAHVSLMSGMEIRDPGDYAVLMTQHRDTLPKVFSAAGYHPIAVMPGTRNAWPEGAFYGFDAIYAEREVDYRGPDFGWWRIPDQFTLSRVAALGTERDAGRPLFAFLPTINTHIPFLPIPPYQPDWQRLTSDEPFAHGAVAASLERTPDWLKLREPYADSFAYTFMYLAGYVRGRMPANAVLILLGDHQPAASVTGEGARWDVPVHVVTGNDAIADRLLAAGFVEGITLPANERATRKMHELTPILLNAFDDPQQASGAERR